MPWPGPARGTDPHPRQPPGPVPVTDTSAMPRLQPYRMTRTTFLFKNSWMPSSPVSRP